MVGVEGQWSKEFFFFGAGGLLELILADLISTRTN